VSAAISGGGSTTCLQQTGSNSNIEWEKYSTSGNPNSNTNRLTSTPLAPGGPVYDAAGHLLSDGAYTYLYNGDGQICAVQANVGGAMTGYLYDADGQRVAKGSLATMSCDPTASGFTATARYVIGPSGEQWSEVDQSGSWHTNVFANGTLIATYDNNGLHFQLHDWLGTRRVQTNYAGTTELSYTSLPFGDGFGSIPNVDCLTIYHCFAGDSTEHHFTGKERDTESGLDYFGARYYGSNMGRWLSPDWSAKTEPVPYAKLDNPQTLNLYAYVQNNPLTSFDVDGHDNYTYDQGGNQTSHTDPHGWWWHQFHDDNYTLNADNGKSYSLNAALTPLPNGQRYTLVSQQTTMQGLNDMLMNHMGSSDNHMSYVQAYDAGLTHAPQGIDFKNELNADFGNNALFVLGSSAHTSD